MSSSIRSFVLLALGAFALLLAMAPAHAESPDQQVEKGLSEFQNLDFAQAIVTLEAVVSASEATPSQRILALELIAISHLSLGHSKKAEAAFERLLNLRPDYELRNHEGSPKVTAAFETVRRRRSAKTSPKVAEALVLSWQNVPDAKAGKRLTISVQVASGSPTSMRLFWNAGGESGFTTAEMRRHKGPLWRGRIRLPTNHDDYSLTFYVEAQGPAGEIIGRLGDANAPASHPVAGREMRAGTQDGAWYGSWKLWAGIGAATLLGGSVAILTSGSDLREGNLPPGRITLSP